LSCAERNYGRPEYLYQQDFVLDFENAAGTRERGLSSTFEKTAILKIKAMYK